MAKNKDDFRVLNTMQIKPSKLNLTEEFRGRATPVGEEAVIALADSLRSTGQQQPIQVRHVEGTDTYDVIFGNTRARAGQLLEGGYTTGTKEIAADDEFTLRCEVVDCSDEQAFAHNVVENAQREATTPIDDAKNQEVLRTRYDMTDAAIARLYGLSGSAHVNRLKKLLTLPQFIQDAIHSRNMTASAGFLLADNKEIREADAYEELWKAIKSDNDESEPSIGTTQLITAIKEWRKAQKTEAEPGTNGEAGGEGGEGDDTGETGAVDKAGGESDKSEDKQIYPMTLKQFKGMLEDAAGSPRTPDKLEKFCKLTLDVLAGKKDSKAYGKAMLKLLGEELLPAPVEEGEAPAAPPTKKSKKSKKGEEAPVG